MTPDAHDENADFVDWVASRQHALLRTAYLMTGDLHRAEDLLQGALIKVADRWRRVRDGNPDAYIRTILYRDNVSWWRKRRESPVAQVRDVAVPQDADAAERTVIVRAALAALTSKQRAVLLLRFFDDLTERETARILGVSVGTVKSQTSVALGRGSGPVVSVDGRLAAWQTSSSGPAEAVVWDLLASREVARKRFPFTPSCCDNPFNVVGIDAAGRVFADGGGHTWVWDTGTGSLQAVRGLGRTDHVTEATTDGVVVTLDPRSKEDSPVALVGKVNDDGRFVEQVRVDGVAGTVSWDGSRFAYLVGGESLRVRDLVTGDERVMKLPTATYVTDLIWETSKTLLVVVESADKGPDAWVRCYSDTGACELAVVLKGSYGVASR